MKKFLKILIVIILIWIIFVSIDYFKYKEHKKPIFARYEIAYLDGGTIEYWGLGYKIIYFNKINDQVFDENPNFKYMGPIWTDYDKAYKMCTEKVYSDVYSSLNSISDRGTYMILKDIYSPQELDSIFEEKVMDDLAYYLKLIDVYENNELNEEDKKWLFDEIKYYYSINPNMDKKTKSKFDLFLYGRDYTGINY